LVSCLSLYIVGCFGVVTLELREIVAQAVEATVQHLFVLRGPLLQRSETLGVETIEAMTTHGATLDEAGPAKNPEVLGDLGLGDREFLNNRADWPLATH